jgi:DNA-binding MarR family transcriptional regulator
MAADRGADEGADRGTPSVPRREVDAVVAACRSLVALSVRSLAVVDDIVDPLQFRALVVIASRGVASLGALADATGLSLSTSSRLCNRLVEAGLIDRKDDPADRRQLALTLTEDGKRVVSTVTGTRRRAVRQLLQRLSDPARTALTAAVEELAATCNEQDERDLWSLGWAT